MALTLVIGNKVYSSWSFRPWIAMAYFGLDFREIVIPLRSPETKTSILKYSPNGKVPALIDGETVVWETLAILDYLNEFHLGGRLWPKDKAAQGMARSIAAEMHGGFAALRQQCPMDMRRTPASIPLNHEVAAQIERLEAMWSEARNKFGHGGPFLFGAFSGADAMYAPVVFRLDNYMVPVKPEIRAYMDAMMALPAWKVWLDAALKEPWVFKDDVL